MGTSRRSWAHRCAEVGLARRPIHTRRHVIDDDQTSPGSPSFIVQTAPGNIEAGVWVGTYRVKRLIGQGGMGRVYLARDASLGRAVALKFLRDRTSPDQLLREARAIAQLSHPNIVVVHGVGRHGDDVFMALEHLGGDNLERTLRRGAMSKNRALRVGLGVARALAHAHANDVVHGDLKPGNVVLASDGRPRVVDFGLAHSPASSDQPTPVGGTPGYMAPEQEAGAPVSKAADVWSLGCVLYELLVGERYGGSPNEVSLAALEVADAPASTRRLVEAALRPNATARPDAERIASGLEDLLEPSLPLDATGEPTPYCGMRAFRERDAGRFFGRDDEIDALVERLRSTPALTIAGPSGAGKSSLVAAGLIPRLREETAWKTIWLRPGARPLAALTAALDDASLDTIPAPGELRAHPGHLFLRLQELATQPDPVRILLVIDQLEEVVTLTEDPAEGRAFLDVLQTATDEASDPIRLIATLREDFVMRVPRLGLLVPLAPLGTDALARAIEAPLRPVGYKFASDETPQALVRDVRDEAAALPLLQFTLRMLWEHRDPTTRTIPASTYEAIGGVGGALSREAELFSSGLSPEGRNALRRLCLALVSADGTRRPLAVDRARALLGRHADVFERLVERRLVTIRRTNDLTAEGTAELTHEALITHWPPLVGWLDDSRAERRARRDLDAATQLWLRGGRGPGELWAASSLDRTRLYHGALAAESEGTDSGAFLSASLEQETRRRRRARRLRIGTIALTLGLSLSALVVARAFFTRAEEARRQAAALRQAATDVGEFDLVLRPFDWSAGDWAPKWQPHSADIEWRLLRGGTSEREPGPEIPAAQLVVRTLRSADGSPVSRIRTRSGRAFLEIRRADPEGTYCTPVILRIDQLPGYADRVTDAPPRLEVPFPTCTATRVGMVDVPGGPTIHGGPGIPPLDHPAVDEREDLEIAGFLIDRMEVSVGQYKVFRDLTELSGYPVPRFPKDGLLALSKERGRPATSVDAYTADAFCAFLGKRLPTGHEWVKAARGGLWIDAARTIKNPNPERLLPWDGTTQRPTNLAGETDGHLGPAPVDAFPAGASPYGILGLAGNVSEWTSSPSTMYPELREVRGASWDTPHEVQMHTTSMSNTREARFFAFDLGFRCAAVDSKSAK